MVEKEKTRNKRDNFICIRKELLLKIDKLNKERNYITTKIKQSKDALNSWDNLLKVGELDLEKNEKETTP